jgi:hypothetical protein
MLAGQAREDKDLVSLLTSCPKMQVLAAYERVIGPLTTFRSREQDRRGA